MCLAAAEAATEKTIGKATAAKAAEEAALAKDAKVESSSSPYLFLLLEDPLQSTRTSSSFIL